MNKYMWQKKVFICSRHTVCRQWNGFCRDWCECVLLSSAWWTSSCSSSSLSASSSSQGVSERPSTSLRTAILFWMTVSIYSYSDMANCSPSDDLLRLLNLPPLLHRVPVAVILAIHGSFCGSIEHIFAGKKNRLEKVVSYTFIKACICFFM